MWVGRGAVGWVGRRWISLTAYSLVVRAFRLATDSANACCLDY